MFLGVGRCGEGLWILGRGFRERSVGEEDECKTRCWNRYLTGIGVGITSDGFDV